MYLEDIKNTIYIFDVFNTILKDIKFPLKTVLVEHDISKLKLMK